MNVKEIRDRIVELGQQGGQGQDDVAVQATNWLNSAYSEVIQEISALVPPGWVRRETVISDVQGHLPTAQAVLRLVKAQRADTGEVLERLHLAAGGRVAGSLPEGVPVLVDYIPLPPPLADGDAEDVLLLPPTLHQGLVWGGLVWSSLFERGFASQSELLTYQRLWMQAKESMRLAMMGGCRVNDWRARPLAMI